MKQQRTIGFFILACSALCFIIAIERYLTAVRTAKAIAELLKGVEFESVAIPVESTVCGLVGVALLVAGILLLVASMRKADAKDGLLKAE